MHYAWFLWTLLFLAVWLIVYFSFKNKECRKEMLIVSLFTSITGLAEPIFVPIYWNPPSLFDLAQKTGFDIESLIFSFCAGGLAVALYEKFFKTSHKPLSLKERQNNRHRFHFYAILSVPIVFLFMLAFANLNPIYGAIISLIAGGVFVLYCRPDLWRKMFASSLIFLVFYLVFFLTLIFFFPGYVEKVWNLGAISGILILGVPLEELLFAVGYGFFWSGVYEHFAWRKVELVK